VFALLPEIIRWFGPAFSVAGYAIVAGAALLERSIFIGLVVPGDIVLAAGGVYAARGELGLGWVITIGVFAAAVGESIGYWLGRRHGKGLIDRIPLVRRLSGQLDAAERYFKEHGGRTVALGRFASAVGTFIPFTAGVARMPYGRFLLFDLPSIAVWGAGIALIGYAFGENVDRVERILSRFGWIMLGILVVLVIGRMLVRRVRVTRA
jgi:membrane-associated protein